MADRFYGVAVGGKQVTDVTEDASTTSAAVNKLYVIEALRAILAYMETTETSPIA